MEYCINGLKIDVNNESLKEIFVDARDKLVAERRREVEKATRASEEHEIAEHLHMICRDRGITLIEGDDNVIGFDSGDTLLDSKAYVDDEEKIHWPVLLLYPEYHTTDLVRDWHEHVKFRDMLQVVLDQPPQWDVDRQYTIESIVVAFRETESTETLRLVDLDMTLGEALTQPEMVIYHRLPTFLLVSRASTTYWDAHVRPYLQR